MVEFLIGMWMHRGWKEESRVEDVEGTGVWNGEPRGVGADGEAVEGDILVFWRGGWSRCVGKCLGIVEVEDVEVCCYRVGLEQELGNSDEGSHGVYIDNRVIPMIPRVWAYIMLRP